MHIYKEYLSVCLLVGIWTLPRPLSPASVPLHPEPKGGGGTLACGWGVGGVPIPTTGVPWPARAADMYILYITDIDQFSWGVSLLFYLFKLFLILALMYRTWHWSPKGEKFLIDLRCENIEISCTFFMFRFLTEEEKRLRARLDQEIRKCHTNVVIVFACSYINILKKLRQNNLRYMTSQDLKSTPFMLLIVL